MKNTAAVFFLLCSLLAWSKDMVQVEVVATHAVTLETRYGVPTVALHTDKFDKVVQSVTAMAGALLTGTDLHHWIALRRVRSH